MTMDKRSILALVLMAAVLLIGQWWISSMTPPVAPKTAETPPARQRETPPTAPPAPSSAAPPAPSSAAPPTPASAPAPVSPPPPPAERARETPRPPQRLATVDTPLYRAVVSSEGGKLQELILKYRGDKPLVMTGDLAPRGLLLGVGDAAPEVVPMALSSDVLKVDATRGDKALTLTGEQAGVRVSETLTFHPDTYTIDAVIRLENSGATPKRVTVALPWDTRQAWHEMKERFPGQHPTEILWATPSGEVERADNLCELGTITTEGRWIATGSIAYMAALIPKTSGFHLVVQAEDRKACEAKSKDPAGRATITVQATPTIVARQSWEAHVTIFAGPKEYDRLKAHGLEGAINFGGFPIPRRYGGLPMEWLGIPILLVMKWIYHYIGNWGIAIIVLTVVSKVLFYPLTVKSMRSMRAMQALQPQINALRSKYKSDPQRLQRETMDLYRQHRVNPMGGCLPMIAQIPIFYALYVALTVSVELQNASFICASWLSPLASALRWMGAYWVDGLWICDLATPDPIYVLPILMGVTMFVQQKMTPVAGDPRQAKMMLLMPVVFTFMFLNLASGLVLYWTVSNVLQIAQQYYMDWPKGERARREARHAG